MGISISWKGIQKGGGSQVSAAVFGQASLPSIMAYSPATELPRRHWGHHRPEAHKCFRGGGGRQTPRMALSPSQGDFIHARPAPKPRHRHRSTWISRVFYRGCDTEGMALSGPSGLLKRKVPFRSNPLHFAQIACGLPNQAWGVCHVSHGRAARVFPRLDAPTVWLVADWHCTSTTSPSATSAQVVSDILDEARAEPAFRCPLLLPRGRIRHRRSARATPGGWQCTGCQPAICILRREGDPEAYA